MEKESKHHKPRKVAVLGGGSWATALIKILSEQTVQIRWWLRNESDIQHIKKYQRNPRYLSSVIIDAEKVKPFSDIEKVLEGADYVVVAIPAAFIREAFEGLKPQHFEDKFIISAVKGMIPQRNILVTDFMEQDYGVSHKKLAAIGGPCHAEEVALDRQSYLTIASPDIEFATEFANMLACRYIKARGIEDLYGVEYCAVLKNIIAISCGIARGLNYGDNFQAVLVSNAMIEIKRFLKSVYKIKRQLSSSAYLGDLLVTCYSQFSRNRTFGNMIGRGYSVKAAQMEMNMVAEGYYAVKSIYEINKEHQVEMPITTAVYNVLYEKISPIIEFQILEGKLA
ncbi:MAG: NAD(P)H-dependent glycerol-3-phosphate dehydrogenase [Flammeovirgaceae bacterium]